MSEKSAFRPCGRDLVEFFQDPGWRFTSKWRCQCGCRMRADFPFLIRGSRFVLDDKQILTQHPLSSATLRVDRRRYGWNGVPTRRQKR